VRPINLSEVGASPPQHIANRCMDVTIRLQGFGLNHRKALPGNAIKNVAPRQKYRCVDRG
jgi:hypothetical protein